MSLQRTVEGSEPNTPSLSDVPPHGRLEALVKEGNNLSQKLRCPERLLTTASIFLDTRLNLGKVIEIEGDIRGPMRWFFID